MKFSFSTEVVDLNNQAPNRNKRESKYYWDELYRLISAGGFQTMETPYEPKWDFGGRSGIPRTLRSVNIKSGSVRNYVAELQATGLNGISCIHLDPSLFCSGMVEMYFGAYDHYAREAIEFAKQAGAETVTLTVTPCFYAVCNLMTDREGSEALFLEKTAELINTLAAEAEKANVKLCLKNEYWGLLRGEKILPFIKGLQNNVYLDIDTAHLRIAGVDVAAFIAQNKDRIGIVHFTDTAFTDDQDAYLQALPEFPAKAATKVICDIGEGNVDFQAVLSALKAAGYDGTIVCNC